MLRLLVCVAVLSAWGGSAFAADEPISPKEATKLFNGKDLGGLTTWLKESKREARRRCFA